MKIILVEQTAKFWAGTDSSSSEQAKKCIINSWQKSVQLQIIEKAQKTARWREWTGLFSLINLSSWLLLIFWSPASELLCKCKKWWRITVNWWKNIIFPFSLFGALFQYYKRLPVAAGHKLACGMWYHW